MAFEVDYGIFSCGATFWGSTLSLSFLFHSYSSISTVLLLSSEADRSSIDIDSLNQIRRGQHQDRKQNQNGYEVDIPKSNTVRTSNRVDKRGGKLTLYCADALSRNYCETFAHSNPSQVTQALASMLRALIPRLIKLNLERTLTLKSMQVLFTTLRPMRGLGLKKWHVVCSMSTQSCS